MPAQRRLALLLCVDSERLDTAAEDIWGLRLDLTTQRAQVVLALPAESKRRELQNSYAA